MGNIRAQHLPSGKPPACNELPTHISIGLNVSGALGYAMAVAALVG